MAKPAEHPTEWFARIESLYQQALDQPEDHRAAFLETACAGDDAAKREVELLLKHYEDAKGSFLNTPAHGLADAAERPLANPERIGRYRIIEVLGRGGMGVVYRAEQRSPKREVALKVIRPGILSPETLRRFELEAEALGRLRHPGIAQIYEAGMHEDGTAAYPFFAMELVEGLPITAFVERHGLRRRDRAALFLQVCGAVHHAHQKGVIHRDLKPENVLVATEIDEPDRGDEPSAASGSASGASAAATAVPAFPKVLDFGVARVIDSDTYATTLRTDPTQLVGTLPYMSPEQIEGSARGGDVRSDVYALGAVLYQLLAGRTPFALEGLTVAGAAHVVCHEEPMPLASVDPSLRGDLNTIVLKALEKDPKRRYGAVSELAADVRRYLNDEPIVARPATAVYQLHKFARRHKGFVAGMAAACVTLVLGIVVSSTFAYKWSRALDESERNRRRAEAVNEFLVKDLLEKADPDAGGTPDTTLREVLDRAAEAIDTRFLDEPLTHASIRVTLGRTYGQLGAHDEAQKHLDKARRIYMAELGPAAPKTIECGTALATAYLKSWDLDEAERIILDCVTAARDALGPRHRITAAALDTLGYLRCRQGRFAEAEQAYRGALDVYESDETTPPSRLGNLKGSLAIALSDAGDNAAAEVLLKEAAVLLREATGQDSAEVAYVLNNLGHVILDGRPDPAGRQEAAACFRESYAIREKRLGSDHPETLRTLYSLAVLFDQQGNYKEAEQTHRDVLRARLTILDEDHMDVLASTFCVGLALEHQGRTSEAIEFFRRAVELGQRRYGPEHYDIRAMRTDLLERLRRIGDTAALRDVLAEYLALLEDAVNSDGATTALLAVYAETLVTCEVDALRDPVTALTVVDSLVDAGYDATAIARIRALALQQLGRRNEAAAVLEHALLAPALTASESSLLKSTLRSLSERTDE